MPATLDHLLWGFRDLDAAVAALQEATGVCATFGGHHPELGTQNALARLGEGRFLEVLAPAPALPAGGLARQLATLETPALIMWAVGTADADAVAARAHAIGLDAKIVEGHRAHPGGGLVRWRNVFVAGHGDGTLVPFFVEWDGPHHPSEEAAPGMELASFTVETPDPERLRDVLRALDVGVAVHKGRRDRLRAAVDTPRGRVVLSGPR